MHLRKHFYLTQVSSLNLKGQLFIFFLAAMMIKLDGRNFSLKINVSKTRRKKPFRQNVVRQFGRCSVLQGFVYHNILGLFGHCNVLLLYDSLPITTFCHWTVCPLRRFMIGQLVRCNILLWDSLFWCFSNRIFWYETIRDNLIQKFLSRLNILLWNNALPLVNTGYIAFNILS